MRLNSILILLLLSACGTGNLSSRSYVISKSPLEVEQPENSSEEEPDLH